jgi:hypothetical protein
MSEDNSAAFTRLLEGYCELVGLENPEIDADGMVFELGDVVVSVTHDSLFSRLSMSAHVADIETERLPSLSSGLLQLNAALALSGGQAFSADMESGALWLQHSLPLAGLAPERLDREIDGLAEKSLAARGLVAKLTELANSLPAPTPAQEEGVGVKEESLLVFRP